MLSGDNISSCAANAKRTWRAGRREAARDAPRAKKKKPRGRRVARAPPKTNLGDKRVPVHGDARVFGLLRGDALDHEFRTGQNVQRHAGFLWSVATKTARGKQRRAKRTTERAVGQSPTVRAPTFSIGFFASRRSSANRSTARGRIGAHSVPQPRFSVDYTPVVRHSDEEMLRNRSSPCAPAPARQKSRAESPRKTNTLRQPREHRCVNTGVCLQKL